MNSLVALLSEPKAQFEKIVHQSSFKYTWLIPIILGVFIGLISAFNINDAYQIGALIGKILILPVLAILICYAYSAIVFFISSLFGGITNLKMTYGVLVYSLIPLTFGIILMFLVRFIPIHANGIMPVIWILIYISASIWSIYLFTVGNSILNNFTFLKSFLTASLIPSFLIGHILFDVLMKVLNSN